MNAVVLWCALTINPFNITLKEKYGPETMIDSVNVVIVKDNQIYVTRNGDLFGVYPLTNYSISKH